MTGPGQEADPEGDPVTRSGVNGAQVRVFGDRAWLVEPTDRRPGSATTAWVLATADRASSVWPQATVVPGLASVLIIRPSTRGPWPAAPDEVADSLAAAAPSPGGASPVQRHTIPVTYDGPDLPDTAALLTLPSEELVRRHTGADWTVAAVGFSPGFGYLTCPDPLFAEVPRRADPRPRVPVGSVALAAGMCAVYPSATPGGWQLIGSTAVTLWSAMSVPPARLRVGDSVRFEVLQ